MFTLKTVSGNLIQMAKNGDFDVIIHGCNCFNNMGAGIAKQIAENFPEAMQADLETTKGDKTKLGTYSQASIIFAGTSQTLTVVNAYTQYAFGAGKCHLDYDALDKVLDDLIFEFGKKNLKFGIPKIGCGLAGGDWSIVSRRVDKKFTGEDITFVDYK